MTRRLVVVLALVVVAAGLVWHARGGAEPTRLSADFEDTTGLYVGNDVEYLGVPVGHITSIERRGTTMRVHMEIDGDHPLPADAGAEILQSSLVTDRYVEVGPAYTGGDVLPDDAVIPTERTRAPATIDEIGRSISSLVRALDRPTPGGRDLGDLISVGADALDGNGARARRALVAGEKALHTVNDKAGAIRDVTHGLADLVDALADRDTTIRRFARSVATSSHVLADQRGDLVETLDSLARLGVLVNRFTAHNRAVVSDDLHHALTLAKVVRKRQDQLAEAFDTMPTLAQNLAQAYDTKRQRLRVQFSTNTGPFSSVFRAQQCKNLPIPLCSALFQSDKTGLLDPLLELIGSFIPGDVP